MPAWPNQAAPATDTASAAAPGPTPPVTAATITARSRMATVVVGGSAPAASKPARTSAAPARMLAANP